MRYRYLYAMTLGILFGSACGAEDRIDQRSQERTQAALLSDRRQPAQPTSDAQDPAYLAVSQVFCNIDPRLLEQ